MKLNENISALVFSLAALLVAACVGVLLMSRTKAATVAEIEGLRHRASKEVLESLNVRVQRSPSRAILKNLDRFVKKKAPLVRAAFCMGKKGTPVWLRCYLSVTERDGLADQMRELAAAHRAPDDDRMDDKVIEEKDSEDHGVESIMFERRSYQIVWRRLNAKERRDRSLQDVFVIGCVVDYGQELALGRSASARRLAIVLVVGLTLVSLVVVWFLVLSARRARVEAALKTKFVANYAHELKTPLASLLLRAEMLKDGRYVTDEKRERALDVIVSEGRRLNGMVLSLLDLIRIECRQMKYACERVDLAVLARGVAETMGPFFGEHGLEVRTEDGVCAYADAGRVREVLDNLLSNAVKYASARGVVELEVARTGSLAVVRVLDRGPGLTPEQVRYVFEEFWRAEDGLTREASGSGIGLFISREHAQGMGGNLSVSPREGGGCVFALELPLDDSQTKEVKHG